MVPSDALLDTLAALRASLSGRELEAEQRRKYLEEAKVLSREDQNVVTLSKEDNIKLLAQFGLDLNNDDGSSEALRCLANVLLQRPDARQALVNLGYAPKLVTRLADASFADEFVISRILFLFTYETDIDFEALVYDFKLDSVIITKLREHASVATNGSEIGDLDSDPFETSALSEILKLLFNITAKYPAVVPKFDEATSCILQILQKQQLGNTLPPATSPLINALLNLNLADEKVGNQKRLDLGSLFEILLEVLDSSISNIAKNTEDITTVSTVALLQKLYLTASEALRQLMRTRLLPTDAEREKPLGQSDTLFSRLIRLSTSASTVNLRDLISTLMFELSDKDPTTFVRNVGYGYASGFLMNNKIDVSGVKEEFEARAESDTAQSAGSRGIGGSSDINFVTGQYRKNEPLDEGPEMTEDEKLREAERLFVLFERLKQTGVVDVENPVAAATREGRFEELN